MKHRVVIVTALLGLALGIPTGIKAADDTNDVPPRGGKGTVRITTTPEKAAAFLGGVNLGKTPVDTSFESGRHTLTLMLNGEELVRERVNVWPNQVLQIDKKLLMPYGSLVLTPNPLNCNCRVTIDGEDVGYTRGGVLTINRIEAGTRVVKIWHGKRAKEFKVDIQAEGTTELAVDFKGK